jgi:hypothetical protein
MGTPKLLASGVQEEKKGFGHSIILPLENLQTGELMYAWIWIKCRLELHEVEVKSNDPKEKLLTLDTPTSTLNNVKYADVEGNHPFPFYR